MTRKTSPELDRIALMTKDACRVPLPVTTGSEMRRWWRIGPTAELAIQTGSAACICARDRSVLLQGADQCQPDQCAGRYIAAPRVGCVLVIGAGLGVTGSLYGTKPDGGSGFVLLGLGDAAGLAAVRGFASSRRAVVCW